MSKWLSELIQLCLPSYVDIILPKQPDKNSCQKIPLDIWLSSLEATLKLQLGRFSKMWLLIDSQENGHLRQCKFQAKAMEWQTTLWVPESATLEEGGIKQAAIISFGLFFFSFFLPFSFFAGVDAEGIFSKSHWEGNLYLSRCYLRLSFSSSLHT